jgi:hypothetical protein
MKNRLECMQPIRFLVVLLMCCLSYTTWAQTQSNVNGLVTDFSGEPLIGVSILVKGTSNGTVTDLEGKYVIKASIGSILSFTYIGYISSYVKIADKNVYNIPAPKLYIRNTRSIKPLNKYKIKHAGKTNNFKIILIIFTYLPSFYSYHEMA